MKMRTLGKQQSERSLHASILRKTTVRVPAFLIPGNVARPSYHHLESRLESMGRYHDWLTANLHS